VPATTALPRQGARDDAALRLDVEIRRDPRKSHILDSDYSGTGRGATEFDCLKGAEGVNYLWPVNERVTIDADVYSAWAGARLTRARRASRELAAAVVKSGRDWFPLGRCG